MNKKSKSRSSWLMIILCLVVIGAAQYHFGIFPHITVEVTEDETVNRDDVVATINNVRIHSNKKVNAIVNTKIIFADESFINLTTCEIKNEGGGYVVIEPMLGCKKVHNERLFSASKSLTIKDAVFDVNVVAEEGRRDIKIVTDGRDDLARNVTFDDNDHKLVIDGSLVSDIITVGIGSNIDAATKMTTASSLSISSNAPNISISTMDDERMGDSALSITVYVPKYMGINVMGNVGKVKINDVQGVFSARIHGDSGIVEAGKMQFVDIEAKGRVRIKLRSADKGLQVDAYDSSDICVQDGSVYRAQLMAYDTASIYFGGNANVIASGYENDSRVVADGAKQCPFNVVRVDEN